MTPINWKEFKRLVEASEEHGAVWALLEAVHNLMPAIDTQAAAKVLDDYQTGLIAAAVAVHEYNIEAINAEVEAESATPAPAVPANGSRWQ